MHRQRLHPSTNLIDANFLKHKLLGAMRASVATTSLHGDLQRIS